MKKYDYEQSFKLKHDELPAKVNSETGEVKILKKRNHVTDNDVMPFEPKALFTKNYTNSWNFLNKKLKPHEFKAAYSLALKAKAFTNSLEPLNDDTVITTLVEELGVGKNQVKSVLNTLYRLGVYGKFEVYVPNKPFTKYWILNPYLSFNGRVIDKSIADIFKDTYVAQAFRKEI